MIRILFYLILVLSVNISILSASPADRFVARGDIYYDKFNNEAALIEYKKAYVLDKNNFEILKRLAMTSNDVGEDLRDTDMELAKYYFRQSVTYAELVNEKFPDEPETHFLLALSYGNLARYSKGKDKVRIARDVEENLQEMIKLRPDFAPSYIALGIYYRHLSNLSWFQKKFADTFFGGLPEGDIEDSRVTLLKAIKLDPDFITTHYEIGKTYLEMDEYEEANNHFNKVLELEVRDHGDASKKEKAKIIMNSEKFKAKLN